MAAGQISSEAGASLRPGFNAIPDLPTDTLCFGAGDRTKLGSNARITRDDPTVRPYPCDKHQRGATLVGLSTTVPFVARTCACNLERALCHRHGVAPPPVLASFVVMPEYFSRVRAVVALAYTVCLADQLDGWIAKWTAVKRRMIRESEDTDAVRPSEVAAMVKREIYHDKPSRPRAIQYYPNLATQAAFGPEFTALQKAYTQHFQRAEVLPGLYVTFASSLDASGLGRWMADAMANAPDGAFYERDGKNWDATMQREHLDLRLAAYAPAGERFADFVESGFDVRGRMARGDLRYTLRGTVKSGHNDTTLGNSIVNASIAVEVAARLGQQGDIIVAGDDLLARFTRDYDAAAFAAAEAEFGIVPDYRKLRSPMDVSFISGVWWPAGDAYVFTPKPGRLVARLFWSTRAPSARLAQAYRNGVVLGLRPTCAALPVVGAFLDAHFVAGVRAVEPLDKQHHRVFSATASATRASLMPSFLDRYGLTVSAVLDCELLLQQCAHRVGLVSHPVLDRLMEVDLADLSVRPLSLEV